MSEIDDVPLDFAQFITITRCNFNSGFAMERLEKLIFDATFSELYRPILVYLVSSRKWSRFEYVLCRHVFKARFGMIGVPTALYQIVRGFREKYLSKPSADLLSVITRQISLDDLLVLLPFDDFYLMENFSLPVFEYNVLHYLIPILIKQYPREAGKIIINVPLFRLSHCLPLIDAVLKNGETDISKQLGHLGNCLRSKDNEVVDLTLKILLTFYGKRKYHCIMERFETIVTCGTIDFSSKMIRKYLIQFEKHMNSIVLQSADNAKKYCTILCWLDKLYLTECISARNILNCDSTIASLINTIEVLPEKLCAIKHIHHTITQMIKSEEDAEAQLCNLKYRIEFEINCLLKLETIDLPTATHNKLFLLMISYVKIVKLYPKLHIQLSDLDMLLTHLVPSSRECMDIFQYNKCLEHIVEQSLLIVMEYLKATYCSTLCKRFLLHCENLLAFCSTKRLLLHAEKMHLGALKLFFNKDLHLFDAYLVKKLVKLKSDCYSEDMTCIFGRQPAFKIEMRNAILVMTVHYKSQNNTLKEIHKALHEKCVKDIHVVCRKVSNDILREFCCNEKVFQVDTNVFESCVLEILNQLDQTIDFDEMTTLVRLYQICYQRLKTSPVGMPSLFDEMKPSNTISYIVYMHHFLNCCTYATPQHRSSVYEMLEYLASQGSHYLWIKLAKGLSGLSTNVQYILNCIQSVVSLNQFNIRLVSKLVCFATILVSSDSIVMEVLTKQALSIPMSVLPSRQVPYHWTRTNLVALVNSSDDKALMIILDKCEAFFGCTSSWVESHAATIRTLNKNIDFIYQCIELHSNTDNLPILIELLNTYQQYPPRVPSVAVNIIEYVAKNGVQNSFNAFHFSKYLQMTEYSAPASTYVAIIEHTIECSWHCWGIERVLKCIQIYGVDEHYKRHVVFENVAVLLVMNIIKRKHLYIIKEAFQLIGGTSSELLADLCHNCNVWSLFCTEVERICILTNISDTVKRIAQENVKNFFDSADNWDKVLEILNF